LVNAGVRPSFPLERTDGVRIAARGRDAPETAPEAPLRHMRRENSSRKQRALHFHMRDRAGRVRAPTSRRTGNIVKTIAALALAAEQKNLQWYVPRANGFEPLTDMTRARREIAAGLLARGVKKGDRVAVVSDTRAEWCLADLAILSIGAVTIGVYPTSTAEQMRYIVDHAKCVGAFVGSGHPQTACPPATTAQSAPSTAGAERAGLRFRLDLDDMSALRAEGAKHLADHPRALDEIVVEPSDVAAIVYTSGTTGQPKGVVLTHEALYETAKVGIDTLGITASDTGVGFLPLAHILARVNFYGTLHSGCALWFSRSLEQVADVWQNARPTAIAVVPRVLEKIQARILGTVAESPARRRKLFARALDVGTQRLRALERGEPVPTRLAMEHALWERLVYRRVRAGLGWDRLRFAICGGAPLRREVAEFFGALGVTVLEGYGLSETSAASVLCLPGAGNSKIGTVGRPLSSVQLKIADDGEILLKSPGLFSRYERDDAATREAFDEQGFFRTGDIGVVDAQGFLKITDRKKDLLVTAGGKNVAPQAIEAKLLADPRALQAVVVGDARPYLVALLVLEPGVSKSAADEIVAQANRELARYEQIKRVAVLDQELTVDNGLLTPTQKVRRRAVVERHASLIDELYGAGSSTSQIGAGAGAAA